MFKNKHGLMRAGWQVAFILAITFALSYSFAWIFFNYGGDLPYSSLGMLIYGLVQNTVFAIIPIFVWKVIYKLPLVKMGITRVQIKRLLAGMGLGLLCVIAVSALIIAFGGARVVSVEFSPSLDLLWVSIMFVAVAFGEEILFRGFIYSEFVRTENKLFIVILVSSVSFIALHLLNGSVSVLAEINLTLFAVCTCFLRLYSDSLWLPIGFHFAWNLFLSLFGFSVSGLSGTSIVNLEFSDKGLINGADFGPEGGICTTPVVVAFAVVLAIVCYKTRHKRQAEQSATE